MLLSTRRRKINPPSTIMSVYPFDRTRSDWSWMRQKAAFNQATRNHWHRADYNPESWMDQQNLIPWRRVRQRAIDYKRGRRMGEEGRGRNGQNGGNEIDGAFFPLSLSLSLVWRRESCTSHEQLELKREPFVGPFSLFFRPDKRSSFPDHQGSLRPLRDDSWLVKGRLVSFFLFPRSHVRQPQPPDCSFPLKPVAPVLRPLYTRLSYLSLPLTLSFRIHPFLFIPPPPLRVESGIKDR